LKSDLLTQSRYAELILDDKNQLILNMVISGTLAKPIATLDTSTLKESFQRKASKLAHQELKDSLQGYLGKFLKNRIDEGDEK
jgi:hypothetical protein